MTRYAGSNEFIRILTQPRGSIRLARASLSLGAGAGWAMTLTVGGGLLASRAELASTPSGSVSWLASTMFFGGLTLAVAGLFVFMLLVTRPIFQGASHKLRRNSEAALGVAVLIGLGCTVLTLVM